MALAVALSAPDASAQVRKSKVAAAKPVYKAIPTQQAESAMPPVAPDRPPMEQNQSQSARQDGNSGASGGYLTGSASATGHGSFSGGAGAMVRPQVPQVPR